jgi:cation:H+ antiporter
MFTWIVIFVVSVIVLVKAADYFTDYAERLGKIIKMPNFLVGMVIVAIGTSLPELSTSVAAVFQDQSEMVAGNVLGTVIANVLLGLGIAAIVVRGRMKFDWDLVSNDMPIFVTAILLVVITLLDGKFTFAEAVIMMLGYLIYLVYTADIHRKYNQELKPEPKKKEKMSPKIPIMLILSLVFIFISAKYTVDSVIGIATILGLGTSVIAASILAIGTSLPEIMVAITAARKRKYDMVIGDIMGSNIFDLLFIFGACGLIDTLTIDDMMIGLLLPFIIGIAIVQWLIMVDKKLSLVEGLLLILTYVLFIGKLFGFI